MPDTIDSISNFALHRGHDRRTVTRRLLAAGVQPICVTSTGRLFRVSDMMEVMTDRDENGASEGDRIDSQLLAVFLYISEFLPQVVPVALAEHHLSRKKLEKITVRLWGEMAIAILDGLRAQEGFKINMPDCIRKLAAKHHFDLGRGKSAAQVGDADEKESNVE